jgi:hypothetical protein
MSPRASIALFCVVVFAVTVGSAYGIGGLGPAVTTAIVAPLILLPISRAYLNVAWPRDADGGDGHRNRDPRATPRKLLIAAALLVAGGLAAGWTASGSARTAILVLTVAAAAWSVGLAWFFARARQRH